MTTVNTPVADAPQIGQAGDMRFGIVAKQLGAALLDPETGLDAIHTAAMKDAGQQTQKPGTDETVSAGGKGDELVKIAKTQLGVNYVYGARQWGKALDCSGFTQQAYAKLGIAIGGDTYTQVTQGQPVDNIENAKPGDLVFFTGDVGLRKNGHVGIYLGGGMMIDAPHTGAQVRIEPIHSNLTAIRRYL